MRSRHPARKKKKSLVIRLVRGLFLLALSLFLLSLLVLAALRFVRPPSTTVQVQRRIEALTTGARYTKHAVYRPLSQISPHLQHAVVAAEDARFYTHHGIDWKEVQDVVDEAQDSGEITRGASTLTQQLVKNLFFTTHANPVRKAAEYVLAPSAEVILGKERILELYLNIAEWGPGIYGAEAAADHHFGTSSSKLSREQSARLAAILPAPLRRKPARMDQYSGVVLRRMRQMGW